jgi:hypothetical protein
MIKTAFGIDRSAYIHETRYFALSIVISDEKKKRNRIFYIKLINDWIRELKETSIRIGEMWVLVDEILLLTTHVNEKPFTIGKKFRVRLEMRRDKNGEFYEALLSRWKEKLNSIVVSKRNAIIKLTEIEDY